MSDSVAPWTVARQAPLPMEVSREEYWSGVQFPTQEIFWTKGEPTSAASPALAGGFFTTSAIWEAQYEVF